MTALRPATQPTLYFIGVSTASSSIMRVFPAWAEHLGLDADIRGIDFPLHADPQAYRDVVAFIRDDPKSRGALVTTHKLDLYKACRDQFDEIDPEAAFMGETSCISKRDARLVCHAKDRISSGLSLDGMLAPNHFANTDADVFVMGAGGAAIAITWHLMRRERGDDVPRRIVVSDTNLDRLEEMQAIHARIPSRARVDYVLAGGSSNNDAILGSLSAGSLVVNATGLGKDRPGSPLGNDAIFPEHAIAWDLNYRGNLVFLDQARAEQAARRLSVENGWTYFIHGWTRVIAEVFDIEIATRGPAFDHIARIAAEVGRGAKAAAS